jgi:cysteine desulfurase family protein
VFSSPPQEKIKPIYFNNAATTYPKPPEVLQEIEKYLESFGICTGRGATSNDISDLSLSVRSRISSLLCHGSPNHVILGKNATEGLNLAISGILEKGDHCVATVMDHNSVLRPLNHNKERGIDFSLAEADGEGFVNISDLEKKIIKRTKLIIIPHASNVTGTINDIEAVVKIARDYEKYLLIDCAQTAGAIPFKQYNYDKMMLAFTGHKALLGPQGIGGLVLGKKVLPKPLIVGGTGSRSDLTTQPEILPDYFESGTHNGIGIAGLNGSLNFIENNTIEFIRNHEIKLSNALWGKLTDISKIKLLGPKDPEKRTGIVSFTINDKSLSVSDLCFILNSSYNIITRSGLLCAPLANKTIGSEEEGVLRLSLSCFNSLDEVDRVASSLKTILQ